MNHYQKGDIILVNFGDTVGSVESGIRPALIICNNKALKYGKVATVLPLTTKIKELPVHVPVENGIIKYKSQVLAEQICTIDLQHKCIKFIGKVSDDTIQKVHNAIKLQIGL